MGEFSEIGRMADERLSILSTPYSVGRKRRKKNG